MNRDGPHIRASLWIYAQLLALYPASFRDAYRREMARTFRDISRRENSRYGWRGLIALWLETFIDLASTVLQEHLAEVRMLSNTRRLARIAGFLGAVGGIFMILTGVPFLRESVGVEPTALHLTTWVLAFLLIAVGTIGYFVAGRQERDINVALGIMLAGGLVTAVGTTLMVPGVEAGWVLFPLGTVAHVLGLLLLGVTAVRNEAFMRPRWLPLLLGAGLFLLFIAAWSGETEQMFGVFVLALGMAWLLLGLLLAGGNVRSNATTPPTAA